MKKQAVGKHKPSTHTDNDMWAPPFSVAPLDQSNPHLRDVDLDPHGSATILAVIVCIGLAFMFVFGLWVGHQWWG